ncbi:hypothetical protein [Enterovibrio coralii]|uniref:hypothetical protein n=1 Tax=Enterovibrio coralii TaxID=294935 RepID=UPI000A60BE32|nr:hypothetical protein [Enterovibrio coralii]
MFYVNDAFFSKEYLAEQYEKFESIAALSQPEGKRFAVCCDEPAIVIALCLFLKEKGGSFYPIWQRHLSWLRKG